MSSSGRQQEVQRIVDTLSMAIAQHRLQPGARLVESQIVDVLAANRNHVQAALRRLALQQIVIISPNRGASVARPSVREAREVFTARRAIEEAIVAGIDVLQMSRFHEEIEAHQQMKQCAIAGGDKRQIIYALSQFHLLLAKMNGNQVLTDFLSTLMLRSALIVALYQRHETPVSHCDEHCAVLDALRADRGDLARSLLRDHLLQLEQQLDLQDIPASSLTLREALTDSRA